MNNVATDIQRVSKHEFCRNTSKWLKLLPLIITNRGNDEIRLDYASSYVSTKFVATEQFTTEPFNEGA